MYNEEVRRETNVLPAPPAVNVFDDTPLVYTKTRVFPAEKKVQFIKRIEQPQLGNFDIGITRYTILKRNRYPSEIETGASARKQKKKNLHKCNLKKKKKLAHVQRSSYTGNIYHWYQGTGVEMCSGLRRRPNPTLFYLFIDLTTASIIFNYNYPSIYHNMIK